MEAVDFDDVESEPYDEHRSHDRRLLSGPLGTTDVSINRYELEPDERFSGARHAHMDQEELFVVLEGEATFETPDGEVTVGPDAAVRFERGEFQTGWNDGDERVVALAIGAPRETEDVRLDRIPGVGGVSCDECGHDHALADDGHLVCPECGADVEI